MGDSRQRVIDALEYRIPDRLPKDPGVMGSTSTAVLTVSVVQGIIYGYWAPAILRSCSGSTTGEGEQMASDKRAAIRNSQLFWNTSDAQMDELVAICEEQSFEAGYRIFSEGGPARDLYIVRSGRVALEMEIRIGSRTKRQAVIDVI